MTDYIGPYELNSIIIGDARELAKAIPDESVDLILTDPPFGIGFRYSNGYDDSPIGYIDLIQWLVGECNRIIKPGGLCFVFQAMPRLRETWQYFPDDSRIFAGCKNFVQMNRGDIPHAFDPVIFWQKTGNLWDRIARDWFVANTANTLNRGVADAGWHDCPRPLDLIIYMTESFCPPKGITCDFFMGSGTSALAAKITGRNFIGFEIDPGTAERARERIRNTQPPLFVLQPEQSVMELSV